VSAPGLIGILGQENSRFTSFWTSIYAMQNPPPGTAIRTLMGNNIAASRNELCRSMLASDAQWLWMLDDDHIFGEETLSKLLKAGRDIIVPFVLTRHPPFRPVTFAGAPSASTGERERVVMEEIHGDGLRRVQGAGAAGMLVRRKVLEQIGDPWFYTDTSGSGEDLRFCDMALEHGFDIWLHLGIPMGHSTVASVWPAIQADGSWSFSFEFAGGFRVNMPQEAYALADEAAGQVLNG
jgi:glycosyl transferase family 2